MFKYGVFSGPYFPIFSLNAVKYEPEKTPYLDTFHPACLRSGKFIPRSHPRKKFDISLGEFRNTHSDRVQQCLLRTRLTPFLTNDVLDFGKPNLK